jgi:Aminoglycoside/hydroxyurea antibiotic resistance kinase
MARRPSWTGATPRALATSSAQARTSGRPDILCDTIQRLHAAPIDPTGLQPLAARFAALTQHAQTGDLAPAADLARALLASTPRASNLHGDLHHDNILHSPCGWLAIDPKGIHGDPASERANAFRNPDGAGDLTFSQGRIAHLADRLTHRVGQPREAASQAGPPPTQPSRSSGPVRMARTQPKTTAFSRSSSPPRPLLQPTCGFLFPKYPRRRPLTRAVLCPSHKTARQRVFAPKGAQFNNRPHPRNTNKP